MSKMSEIAANRRVEAVRLRETGKTFAEIGAAIKCGASRAREIYISGKWRQENPETVSPLDGLSTRAANCLSSVGVETREQVKEVVEKGILKPLKFPKNYGWETHREIHRWLGINEPERKTKTTTQKICPHCGGKL